MQKKARRWCFTWNNYTAETVTRLSGQDNVDCDYLVFGFELAPSSGTPHLQGYVEFKSPLAGSTVKSRLDPQLKAKSPVSVRTCNGTRDENIAYVRKDETKDPAKLDTEGKPLIIELAYDVPAPGKRNDWEMYYEFLLNNPDFDDFACKYPEIAIKYHAGVEKIIRGLKSREMHDKIRARFVDATLRPWQQALVTEVQSPANDRKIVWYYDEIGNSGKTWVSKMLYVMHGAAYFCNSKSSDVSYAYEGQPIVVFDFSRSNEEVINYQILESIKNGMLFSSKYESRTKMFEPPHVIVMANFRPNYAKMSLDRWDVRIPNEGLTDPSTTQVVAGGNTGA